MTGKSKLNKMTAKSQILYDCWDSIAAKRKLNNMTCEKWFKMTGKRKLNKMPSEKWFKMISNSPI